MNDLVVLFVVIDFLFGFWSKKLEGINRVDFGYELEGVRVFF